MRLLKQITAIALILVLSAAVGCSAGATISEVSPTSSVTSLQDDTSSEASSAPVSSGATVSTVDPNHPYYDVIMAIQGLDRTRYGFSFGLQVDE